MADIAHISGLVATKEQNSPFEYAHIVTTTTNKSLRGARSGLIFYRKQFKMPDYTETLQTKINFSVFPRMQGGPHNNQIAGVCCQLLEVMTPEFKTYAQNVKENCKQLTQSVMDYGYKLLINGTDNHIIMWDLRPLKIPGSHYQYVCDLVHITVNKNMIFGDKG